MSALRFGLIAPLVLMTNEPTNAADEYAAQLVAVCASCHRFDGQDKPSITGLPPNDLKSAMWVFRSDDSSNPVMHAVSLTFSEAEIAIIAERLSHWKSPPRP